MNMQAVRPGETWCVGSSHHAQKLTTLNARQHPNTVIFIRSAPLHAHTNRASILPRNCGSLLLELPYGDRFVDHATRCVEGFSPHRTNTRGLFGEGLGPGGMDGTMLDRMEGVTLLHVVATWVVSEARSRRGMDGTTLDRMEGVTLLHVVATWVVGETAAVVAWTARSSTDWRGSPFFTWSPRPQRGPRPSSDGLHGPRSACSSWSSCDVRVATAASVDAPTGVRPGARSTGGEQRTAPGAP